MRLLHTSDWHLGQSFHGYDRGYEQQRFLDWLLSQIQLHQPDQLLMAGDVFDTANPSAAAQAQFYGFLAQARRQCPHLQLVITAGNHDAAGRLEAPNQLLSTLGIDIIGTVKRLDNGDIDVDALVLPLCNADQQPMGWCLALPFLRPADLPKLPGAPDPYAAGVAQLYQQALDKALARRTDETQPIIAMGHLHLTGSAVSELSERRLIVGGNEALPASMFGSELAYVALGHLHRAQSVSAAHIRYCGSPIPMSFSEVDYRHQILLVDLVDGNTSIQPLTIPRAVNLLRLGAIGTQSKLDVEQVLQSLRELSLAELPLAQQPFVEVCLLLDQPEPHLRQRVEQALADQPVRLARIHIQQRRPVDRPQPLSADAMQQLTPDSVFASLYASQFQQPMSDELAKAFAHIATQAQHQEQGE